ncbi:MAG: PD-(D/E)XK nuclease family protein [Candidatus Brocadiia bacterium]
MPKKSSLFDPASAEPFRLSRSRIDKFIECPRCFYLEMRLGVKPPGSLPFTLNNAVDHLLKKEFDAYRAKGQPHPLMTKYSLSAKPYQHKDLDKWRQNFVGIQHHHKGTNFLITGAVDDVWENSDGRLHIVDYKATSKADALNLDSDWQAGWKRQMEVYQWLFRQNGFKVAETGYFVYCNGRKDREGLNGRLDFELEIFPYDGDAGWVETRLKEARECLSAETPPGSGAECELCAYASAVQTLKPAGKGKK